MLDGVWIKAAAPTVVSPSGVGTLGTVSYLGGNLALDADEDPGTPNDAGLYPTSTSSATAYSTNAAGGHDGAGKNAGFNGATSWHTAGGATFWTVDLGDLSGLPNPGNQTYAIGSIQVYSRSDCCWNQSNGAVDLLDDSGGTVFSGTVSFGNPRTNVADVLDFGSQEVFGRAVTYRNMASFNELEVHGVRDYVQDVDDVLEIDLAPDGNDFVYVEGAAVLAGTLQFNPAGGWTPAQGGTFDILTASSIDISALKLDLSAVPTSLTFQLSLAAGGAGQILSVSVVPEPSTLVLMLGAVVGLVGFGWRRRRTPGRSMRAR